MRIARASSGVLLIAALFAAAGQRVLASDQSLLRLLETGQCPKCDLRGADLVHAQLPHANLQGALLQGANLSRANLAGANLNGADLRQASLMGANLSQSSLMNTLLEGADLSEADFQGARVGAGALRSANLEAALHLPERSRSAAAMHNQAASAYQAGQFAVAERQFSEAIVLEPDRAQSWIARSMARTKMGDLSGAKADLLYASRLAREAGNDQDAVQIDRAVARLEEEQNPKAKGGQMQGFAAVTGAILKVLAPLAMKAMTSGMF